MRGSDIGLAYSVYRLDPGVETFGTSPGLAVYLPRKKKVRFSARQLSALEVQEPPSGVHSRQPGWLSVPLS